MAAQSTSSHSSADKTTSSSTASLDLAAVLRASQALSSELELEPLLTTLLQVVTESAGADRGAVLLLQDGVWQVAAIRQMDQSIVFPSSPLATSQDLPIVVIDTLKRTLNPMVISQVTHPLLLTDPYILREQPQSVLCLPILHQGKLSGFLYLESHVSADAFTSDRVEWLNLLCPQAAIALEHARLYQQSQQALAALRNSEVRFQTLAANLPGMIYQIRIAPDGSGSTLYVSSGCMELYGIPPEEFLTGIGDLRTMEHPDDRPAITQAMIQSAETLTPFAYEWRIITPSGTVKWVQAASRPERQADGSIIWDGVQMDISDRKRAEADRAAAAEALQTSEQNLRAIFNSVSSGILVHDLNGIVQDANDSALRLYQLERAQLPQISVLNDCSAPDSPFHLVSEWWDRALAGKPVTFEWNAKRFREGTVFATEVSLTRIVLNGEAMILGNVQDISDRQAALRDRKEAEQQLQASQQLLELVLNTIPHKVFWKDCDLVYQGSNRAFGEVVGFTPAEIVGKSDYDLPWTIDESDWFRECDRRVMESNKPKLGIIETTLQADGTTIWIETSKLPLHDPTGVVIGVLGIYQDITDRKQTEVTLQQALQEKEYQTRLLQTVLDSTHAWIFAKDRDFRYIMVNRSYADAVGQTIESMLGKDDLELGFPEALVLGDPAKNIRGFRTDDRRVLAGEIIHNPHDPATVADGSLRIFDTRKNPLYDTDGTIFATLGFCHDVTDRKQAEIELRTSQQRLSLLIQQTPLAVIEWDAALRVRSWNPAAEQIFGFTAAEVSGQPMSILLPDADVQFEVDQVMAQLLSQTGGTHSINKNLTKAGKVIFCEWYNNPIVEDGTLIGIATMALDITERHHAETVMRRSKAQLREKAAELEQTLQELQRTQSQMVQSEKMSGLGQLVAGVAHEINNPVNFIYGNLTHANSYTHDILGLLALYQKHHPTPHAEIQAQEDAIDLDFLLEDLPKLLASMRVGAERIQKIVASLRNFSRMDEAEVKAVNLHDGIDSTLMILQHRLKSKPDYPGIEIIKEYGNLPLVECYAGQLNQVFMNLLSNAIDALDEKLQSYASRTNNTLEEQLERQSSFRPTITICTTYAQQQIQIRFADNGSGIPDAVKSKLFDPFFTTKPIGSGTGMGLSISHQIVTEKHGGSLECVSAPGQGTVFIIEIPLQR